MAIRTLCVALIIMLIGGSPGLGQVMTQAPSTCPGCPPAASMDRLPAVSIQHSTSFQQKSLTYPDAAILEYRQPWSAPIPVYANGHVPLTLQVEVLLLPSWTSSAAPTGNWIQPARWEAYPVAVPSFQGQSWTSPSQTIFLVAPKARRLEVSSCGLPFHRR